MTRERLHGDRQRAIVQALKRQPQNSYPLPARGTERDAVRTLARKGWVSLEENGTRYRLIR